MIHTQLSCMEVTLSELVDPIIRKGDTIGLEDEKLLAYIDGIRLTREHLKGAWSSLDPIISAITKGLESDKDHEPIESILEESATILHKMRFKGGNIPPPSDLDIDISWIEEE